MMFVFINKKVKHFSFLLHVDVFTIKIIYKILHFNCQNLAKLSKPIGNIFITEFAHKSKEK